MGTILTVSGSPSPHSRTGAVLRRLAEHATDRGHTVHTTAVRDLPPAALLAADAENPAVRQTLRDIASADAVVLGLNAVSDGRHVVMSEAAHELARALEQRGFVPVPVDLSELLKGGGGIKCCTLEIRRTAVAA